MHCILITLSDENIFIRKASPENISKIDVILPNQRAIQMGAAEKRQQ